MLNMKTCTVTITNLKRKDRVGTVFTTTNKVNGVNGYATLIHSKRDGTRVGKFHHNGAEFTFQSGDKALWPDNPSPIGKKNA